MNHPLFGAPNTQLGNPLFGQVTGQENAPRQLQLGLIGKPARRSGTK